MCFTCNPGSSCSYEFKERFLKVWDNFHFPFKCFSKRVAKRIRNLQAKFINTRMTSFWMYVSAAAILVGPNTRKFLRDLTKRKLWLKSVYMYTILLFLNLIPLWRYMLTSTRKL